MVEGRHRHNLTASEVKSSKFKVWWFVSDSVSVVTVLAGATGRLPCETMAMGQDRLKLVLWFRNMSDTPFYTWVYTYTWVSVLIMIINIISDSGLVTFLRLLFLADTFLQHFLQIFSQIFLQHFLWWHFNYEFLVAMTILFVYSFKSDADGEKDLKRIRNTVLRCWL